MTSPQGYPESLGFRSGATSSHTSRTMMFQELSRVLNEVPATASRDAYQQAIIDDNALGKPTRTTRERTTKRLVELYALDPGCALFRLLRHFWAADVAGRPMLAFLLASARDPLLREATSFVLSVRPDESVNARMTAEYLVSQYPSRFRSTTLSSTARNLASSWTQAGYVRGKIRKMRVKPLVTPVVLSYAVLLGYLCGVRGKLLLDSLWTRLLDRPPAEIMELTHESSKQGWLTYKGAGSVVEIGFPGLLKTHEERAAYESN